MMALPVRLNISKIQSESYSQQGRMEEVIAQCKAQYFKDTIWKLLTTMMIKEEPIKT